MYINSKSFAAPLYAGLAAHVVAVSGQHDTLETFFAI